MTSVLYDGERGIALEPIQESQASSRVDLVTPNNAIYDVKSTSRITSHPCIRHCTHCIFVITTAPLISHPLLNDMISLRMDWLDLFAAQGTLKSLLQHHSSKASIFRCSAVCRGVQNNFSIKQINRFTDL